MPVIRVGVQAPQGSAGQVVDLDGPRASITSIANVSGESIAYSLDGGTSWTTLAAGASGGSAVIDAGMLRLRKVASSGAYPAPVDVTADLYGLSEEGFTAAQVAALQGVVSRAGITADDTGTAWLGAPALLSFSAVLASGTATTVLLEVRDSAGTVATAATIVADTVGQTLRQSLLMRQQSEYRFRRSSGTGSVTVTV